MTASILPASAFCLVFILLSSIAFYCDVTSMRIPNWISSLLAATAAAAWFSVGLTPTAMGFYALTGAIALILGFGLFAMGAIGGGDAKLAAAIALWLGPGLILDYFIAFSLIGGVLAVLALALRRFPLPPFLAERIWIGRVPEGKDGIPYGVALSSGGVLTLFHTPFYAEGLGRLWAFTH